MAAKAPDFGFIYDLRRGLYVNGASLCPCCEADDGYDKCEYCGGKGWVPEEWDDEEEAL